MEQVSQPKIRSAKRIKDVVKRQKALIQQGYIMYPNTDFSWYYTHAEETTPNHKRFEFRVDLIEYLESLQTQLKAA